MNKSIIRRDEHRPRYKVGSRAFFEGYPDFHPKDIDEVEFETEPKLYKNFMQFRKKDGTRCLFKWRKMTPDEFVDYMLGSKLPMELGKFLVPEVAEYLGINLHHLAKLRNVSYKLDDRHKYEAVILEAYLENGGFYLTEDQRNRAYEEYKRART